MSISRASIVAACVVVCGCASVNDSALPARTTAFGELAPLEMIAAWDISIPPSGAGLPKGGGTARQGVQVYEQKCQSCHGAKGAGKPADPLAGGAGTLASKAPLRT